jgi:hypothetical protein
MEVLVSLVVSAVIFIVLVHIATRPLEAKLDRIIELLKRESGATVVDPSKHERGSVSG